MDEHYEILTSEQLVDTLCLQAYCRLELAGQVLLKDITPDSYIPFNKNNN